jgi:hypothetical protein
MPEVYNGIIKLSMWINPSNMIKQMPTVLSWEHEKARSLEAPGNPSVNEHERDTRIYEQHGQLRLSLFVREVEIVVDTHG